jgi:hypothetical protein
LQTAGFFGGLEKERFFPVGGRQSRAGYRETDVVAFDLQNRYKNIFADNQPLVLTTGDDFHHMTSQIDKDDLKYAPAGPDGDSFLPTAAGRASNKFQNSFGFRAAIGARLDRL